MVATVLRLRYRVLANTLRRSPWQLVGFVFGLLGGLWLLGMVVAGLVALAVFQPLETARIVTVLAGSLLLLGWVLAPVLVAGTDNTVSSAHLAQFPMSTRQVMRALAGAGLTGAPGIVTALAALASVILWLRSPLAAVVAVPCAALAVLTCVVASRLTTTLSAGLGGNRRGREVVGTVVLFLVILIGPVISGVTLLLSQAEEGGFDLVARGVQAAEVLGWTPVGAAWAVPGDVAVGAWGSALAKLGIAAATLAVLWLVWDRALDAAIATPQRSSVRRVATGALGLFGRFPTGGVGATWARSLTAWLRDPRYSRSLLLVPIFPIIFGITGGLAEGPFRLSALIAAFVLSFAGFSDISYDGRAFASVLATGISGRADRLGRLLAAASVSVPMVLVVAVATTLIAGVPEDLPALLGGSFGILLAGLGVSAVSSAMIVMPVAAAGDSPFKSVPGQSFLMGISIFAVMGATAVLAAPALVLTVIALVTSSALFGWLSLLTGLVVGVAAIWAGVVLGGRAFDRSGPELLARIRAFPTS